MVIHSLFEGVLEKYDVYKVETIGDEYMVASGVPVKNDSHHVTEVSMDITTFHRTNRIYNTEFLYYCKQARHVSNDMLGFSINMILNLYRVSTVMKPSNACS